MIAKAYFESRKRNKLYLDGLLKKIKDEIKADGTEENFEDLFEIANYIYEDEEIIDFDFGKELKEETLKLTFGETFIKIPYLEVKNNFLEIKVNLKRNSIKYIPIFRLLEVANTEKRLESKEVNAILENRDRKLRKGEINKLVKKEMKNNNLPEEDFILFNSKKGNYEIFISDKFQW